MRALLDVNALIALFDVGHIHHELTHNWLIENADSGWASYPLTQNGCVRILSQPNYPNSMSTKAAIGRVREALKTKEHEFWPDDLAIIDESFFHMELISGPKAITDLYLLGLAVKNNGRLVTFDRRINPNAVIGASPQNLVILGN